MKNILSFLLLFFFSQLALSLFGTTIEIKATNVCTYCAIDMQGLLNYDYLRYKIPQGSTSVLVIQKLGGVTDESEYSVFDKLQKRILSFAKNETSFSKTVVQKAQQQAVNFKLYYQLAVDKFGQLSIYNGRNKPTYEIEKEIPHELWGYYQIIDNQPYVLINEYQNFWNADYTVIHELTHLYDQVSADYIEKNKTNAANWHLLDDLALEFRAVLAEVQYRQEIKSSKGFTGEPLLKSDFRDKLIEGHEISHQRILNYVQDLLVPIKFNKSTTQQLASATSESGENQNAFIFDVIDDFFKNFFESLKTLSKTAKVLGLTYKIVQTDQLGQINRQTRLDLVVEAQKRGASGLMDYLVKNNLTRVLESATVRRDGHFNQLPHKTGGPSPRTGGGSP